MATINKAVIFDMDGVIVDSEYAYLNRLEGFFNALGNCVTMKDLALVAGSDDDAMWYVIESILHQSFDHDEMKEAFSRYLCDYPVIYADIMNEGIETILKKLQQDGYQIALASSSKMAHISQMLDTCDLRPYFDIVLSGDMFEKTKPDPAIYLKAISLLKLPKKDCIVIEDSTYGIRAATSAGLYTMAKKETRFYVDQSLADVQFTTYEEAYQNIKKKNFQIYKNVL